MSSGGDITLRPPPAAGPGEEEGEVERGKFGDPKKLHKQNKELAKTNTQLNKLIDTLRHERDSLALDKTKLKSELKSTEKELKKANSGLSSARSEVDRLRAKSHKQGGGATAMGEGSGELQERVRQLEAELSQRDEKLEKFRKRIGGRLSQMENIGGDGEPERRESLREREKLVEENSELRQRVVNLETDLNMLLKLMDDQQKEDFVHSSSTELSLRSSIFSPSSFNSCDVRRSNRESPSPFSSPRNSPAVQRGNKTCDDLATLQSCLQLALEEKKTAEQQARELQTQLDSVRGELEETERSWGQEKEKLLRQILKAHGEAEARARVEMSDRETQHPLTDTLTDTHPPSGVSSEPTRRRSRTSSSGSLTSSTEQDRSSERSDAGRARERARGKRGSLKKQRSRENFATALAVFKSGGETVVASPTRERRPSDTSQGSQSARSSTSPAPPPNQSSPRKLSTERVLQTVTGKPPIPPVSSGHHSRQSSTDESGGRSPTKMSIGAKRTSWTVSQRRKSFEEQTPGSPTVTTPQHSRTASSPIMTRPLGSPVVEKKPVTEEKTKEEKRFEEERARREQERRKRELEAEEKRRRELEEKTKEEKRFEEERARREQERRKRELEAEEKRRRELEQKRRREEEEKERQRKEKEARRVREEKERERKREMEEKRKREKEEREKRQEEVERKRQLEEKRRKEQQAERERQRAKEIELERKKKEEQEAALRKQREEEEQKKKKREALKMQEELLALKRREGEEDRRRKQKDIEKRLRLEEEKRAAEKAAQAATDPLPSKLNQLQSPFGSIAMRRAAFEQNTSPSTSPPVVLRRNASHSPIQRPKSVDFAAMMSTAAAPSSPAVSPTPHISIRTSRSPQASPVLGQRSETREVSVGRGAGIPRPAPPVTTPRMASVSITASASSSPPLRRAQTISLTPASLAVSSPDLTSIGTSNGSSSHTPQEAGWSPQRTTSAAHKSPLSERKMAKSVTFSPNLSTANRPPGILKPTAPPPTATVSPHTQSSVNRTRFGPAQARLGVPSSSEDLKKAQSLQNIPEHAMAEDTTPSTAPTAAPHVTRRPRSERAKTTSLSRADTVNLVNLISQLQDKDKPPPVRNGVDSSPHQKTTYGRPASMYGSITPSR